MGVSNLWPPSCMRPRMAVNVAQHKIVNSLKTIFFIHRFSSVLVYLMWGPRQLFFFQCGRTRDAKRLDTPGEGGV